MDNLDNLPLNIEELRNNCDALSLLKKTSQFLDTYYFEKKVPSSWTYSWENIHSYLTDSINWDNKIWNNRFLYIYRLSDKFSRNVNNVSFDSLIIYISKRSGATSSKTLTGFKINDPEVQPKAELSDKIKRLEVEISEIKELLKKMVV